MFEWEEEGQPIHSGWIKMGIDAVGLAFVLLIAASVLMMFA